MASKRLYKGSPCKHDCGGHKAGARYARGGGAKPSPSSRSFNNGMKIAQGGAARRSTRRK